MSTSTQLFGGPYYYFKKDQNDSNRFEELITLAIMGNDEMTDFTISERHFAEGARVSQREIGSKTLEKSMDEMARKTEIYES